MGYCPFSSLGHDTTDCIMTQGWAGARNRHGDTAPRRCNTAPRCPAIRPARGYDTADLRAGARGAHARGRPGLSGSRNNFCIVTGG